nr:unnamed protein product [Callosobruchus analis]
MEELLIENVRKYEVLYNHSSRDYRDQRIRQEAWEEIGKELKITAEKAKQLWDKLRCFNNARNRRLSTKSGQATKTVPPWKFEQEMSFLLPYLEGRRTFSNLIPDVENNADVQESHAIADTEISNATDNEEESRVGTTENTPQEDTQVDKKIDQLHQLQTPKKYSKTTAAAELVHIMKENAHLRKRRYENQDKATDNKKTSPLENMDDTDLFFLSMSKMVKKLPKYEQATVKLAVSNAVFEAEKRSSDPSDFKQIRVSTPLSSAQSSSTTQSAENYNDLPSNFETERRPTLLEMTTISYDNNNYFSQ